MDQWVTCPNPECGRRIRAGVRSCLWCNTVFEVASDPLTDAPVPKQRSRKTTVNQGVRLVMRIATTGGQLSAGRCIPIEDGVETVVGRSSDGPIGEFMEETGDDALSDVSREHLTLTADGREIVIYDTSAWGTYVDGKRLPKQKPERYRAPVTLRLATSCWIRVELEQ